MVFAGQVGDVPKLLSQADVFVLPSLSEGLPIAMLEAMAAGVPCVVTDIGLPVEKGKTALVVPPGDFKSLASATNRLLRDEKLAKTLSENALKKIRAEFSSVFLKNIFRKNRRSVMRMVCVSILKTGGFHSGHRIPSRCYD